ncbi:MULTISPECIES: DUF4153 domain-containing protein [unclassified Brevundimonas]|uniref:DUF4153 domain-containing protein n=1 Tax=unclassified Brevundimonas TaxID=2622653 RepID=UPI003F9030FA
MFNSSIRSSYWLKVGIGLLLGGAADAMFFMQRPGATLGLFALLWLAAAALFRKGWVRDRRGLLAAASAAGLAGVMIDRPSLLAWVLFGLALMIAVQSARVRGGEDVWRWAQRLIVQVVVAVAGPWIDLIRLNRTNRRRQAFSLPGVVRLLILPVLGGAVFLALFASANPVIGDLAARLRLPPLSENTVARVIFWGVVLIAVAGFLRPRWRRRLIALPSLEGRNVPGVTAASVTLSLIVFNLLFAMQNGLDLAFLWSGAPLPEGVTLAEYAHRGAYPLIVTALLAGLFVLIFLRPGSETATRPLVRRLVVLWVGQNLFLVASSLLRTAAYIEAYSLTRFRIAAMIWMVLVGLGLGLICWRVLRNKSASWLINANVGVALTVLGVVSVVDLGAIAAHWNVRHAREVDGQGSRLDLCYLDSLNGAALVSLVELEQQTADSALKDRVAALRDRQMAAMQEHQSKWRGWRWRDARRLDRVEQLTAARPLTAMPPGQRDCDGRLITPSVRLSAPPSTPSPIAPPLTSEAGT